MELQLPDPAHDRYTYTHDYELTSFEHVTNHSLLTKRKAPVDEPSSESPWIWVSPW